MAKSKAEDNIRLNFYMKKSFVQAVDDYANEIGVSRPAAFNFIISQWCESRRTLDSFNKIADKSEK